MSRFDFSSMMSGLISFVIGLTILCFGGCRKHDQLPILPTVTTTVPTDITAVSAEGGGSIGTDGNTSITSRGVCWSTSSQPTTSDSKAEAGNSSADFLVSIIGLQPNTVYYIRAYAIANAGAAYGNEISFTTQHASLELDAIKDASIFNNLAGDSPQKDYGSGGSQVLRVGYSQSEDVYARSLVQFDLSSVPQGVIVDSVSLIFTTGKSGTSIPLISIYRVTQSWSEGTTTDICDYYSPCQTMGTSIAVDGTDATWINTSNTTNPWSTTGGSFVSSASATSADSGATLDFFVSNGLISDVQDWLTTPATNFGWLLKVDEPSVSGNGAMKRYVSKDFVSNSDHPAARPRLYVRYH